LLLVARDDRRMRIEVGYGLEGTLTDLHSKLIIENTMVPAFRAGDFSGGISGAVDDIIMVLEGNGAELQARAERNQPVGSDFVDLPVLIFFAIWGTLFFGGIAMSFLPPMFGRKIGPGRYHWLGMDFDYNRRGGSGGGYSGGGWSSGSSSGGWSSGGGGFSGGGGSSGGGGASGSW
ncbi:YgcG family protein, partial [Rhizobiaceae sp. 2RAB30]